MKIIFDVSAYVEAHGRYQTDFVELELNESTKRVTVYPVDVEHVRIAGSNAIVDTTLGTLDEAIAYYLNMEEQLRQGDIIRNN